MDQLRDCIRSKSARIAVIGLGYVGLPVAAVFAEAGFDVLGVEIRPDRVELINQGKCPIEGEEPGLATLLSAVVGTGRLRATADYRELADCNVVLIDVETPVDEQNLPRYEALRASVQALASVLMTGALVIVESTTAPGTVRDFVLPLLEQGGVRKVNRDFYLGNCPERVMPGKLLNNLRSVSRVAGGMSPATAETMIELYRWIVQADIDPADCTTAELVKTTENAYRDVQIAFANEVALICDAVGSDVWRVRELVNKSPFRQMHLPGAGVGGHCIPKDPWLLASAVKDSGVPLRLIPAARAVNNYMPEYVAKLVENALVAAGCSPRQSRVLVMGYAYLENSDDVRNSPSSQLVQRLRELGADMVIHDPCVKEYNGLLPQLAEGADALVVMVAHSDYRNISLAELATVMRTRLIVDGRSVYSRAQAEQAGFRYLGLGKGATR